MVSDGMVERIAHLIDAEAFFEKASENDFDRTMRDVAKQAARRKAEEILRCISNPTSFMVKAGVQKALSSKISGSYRWPDYISDLFGWMIKAELLKAGVDMQPDNLKLSCVGGGDA